jgi:hypothetical protein
VEVMDVEPIAESVQRVTNAIAILFAPKLDVSRTAQEAFNVAPMGVVVYAAPALWAKPVQQQGFASPMDVHPLVRASNVGPMDAETSVESVKVMSLAVQMASALLFVPPPAWENPVEITAAKEAVGAASARNYAKQEYANPNALQIVRENNVETTGVEGFVAHVQEANCAKMDSVEMPVSQIVRPNSVEVMGVVETAGPAPRERPVRPTESAPNREKEAGEKGAGAA